MIIQFSKDIKLNSWSTKEHYSYCRTFQNTSCGVCCIMDKNDNIYRVIFRDQLDFVNNLFEMDYNWLCNLLTYQQFYHCKDKVDNLLIKISKLKAFI